MAGASPALRRSASASLVVAAVLAALALLVCRSETSLFLRARFGSLPSGGDATLRGPIWAGSSQQVLPSPHLQETQLPLRRVGDALALPRDARRQQWRIKRRAESDAAPDSAHASPCRVGVIFVPSFSEVGFQSEFEKLNVTSDMFFQTEVPDAFQLPLAAKLLAMSNTVDVIMAAHGELKEPHGAEIIRGFQTVSLTANVPVVPVASPADVASAASSAVQMAEIVQQAKGTGVRRSIFFGIGANTTAPAKKEKVYF